ncbi:MAG: hypothetical protein WC243_04350 [Patescibacteria group bacterium]
MAIKTVLLVLAVVCFFIKAISVDTGRIDCFSLGWMFVVASLLF